MAPTRVVRSLKQLANWYLSPSGFVYLAAIAAGVVLGLVASPTWGLMILVVVVAILVPWKLAHLEARRVSTSRRLAAQDQRLAAQDQRLAAQDQCLAAQDQCLAAQDQRLAAQDQRLAAQDQRLAAQDQRLAAQDQRLEETGKNSAQELRRLSNAQQSARRDSLTALDTAKNEWRMLLRAERARNESLFRGDAREPDLARRAGRSPDEPTTGPKGAVAELRERMDRHGPETAVRSETPTSRALQD